MAEDIQIEVLAPEQLFGSTTLSLTVRITNLSPEELFSVSVEPVILPGRLVKIGRDDEDAPMVSPQFESRCTVLRSIAQGLAGLVPTEWNRSQVSGWPWRKILPDAGLLAVLAVLSSWLIRR